MAAIIHVDACQDMHQPLSYPPQHVDQDIISNCGGIEHCNFTTLPVGDIAHLFFSMHTLTLLQVILSLTLLEVFNSSFLGDCSEMVKGLCPETLSRLIGKVLRRPIKALWSQVTWAYEAINLAQRKVICNNTIQFCNGFKTLKLSINGGVVVNLVAEGEKDTHLVEIVVGLVMGSPLLKVGCCRLRTTISSTGVEEKFKSPVESTDELPISASSALLKGSPATIVEERVSRIASSPPHMKQIQRTRILRNIIQTCAAQVCEIKEQYMRHLKGVISHKFEKEILEEERTEARNLTPQPVRGNKKYVK
ncbi:hypothetical protein M5K25_008349 [Dendrobium thyrsiflorum]|uniref:Uncharacterized protein n=1 Tax=Dendrobium thyrsiflorum TaxID=117978 RepID=A0ABD0V8Z6_DENTH